VLQECYRSVTRVLQECYKSVNTHTVVGGQELSTVHAIKSDPCNPVTGVPMPPLALGRISEVY
jgi:hypothetical protein